MIVCCIKDKENKGNFTVGKHYEIIKNTDKYFGDYIFTADYMCIFMDEHTANEYLSHKKGKVFQFSGCKFKVIKQ